MTGSSMMLGRGFTDDGMAFVDQLGLPPRSITTMINQTYAVSYDPNELMSASFSGAASLSGVGADGSGGSNAYPQYLMRPSLSRGVSEIDGYLRPEAFGSSPPSSSSGAAAAPTAASGSGVTTVPPSAVPAGTRQARLNVVQRRAESGEVSVGVYTDDPLLAESLSGGNRRAAAAANSQ